MMRRLGVRLALAMIGTMVMTLVIVGATQKLAEVRAYWALPEEVRSHVPAPRPWLDSAFGWWVPERRPPPAGAAIPETSEGREAAEAGVPQAAASDAGAPPALPTVSDAGAPPALPAVSDAARGFVDYRRYQNDAFVLGVAVAALGSVVLAWWMARRIARPIAQVSHAAAQVAGGDLAVRVPVTPAVRRSSLETLRLSEDFNRMAAALETYEAERKAMIADIAHELRTPLTAMKLRLQALEDGLVPFRRSEVERLHRSADLLARLIEDLRILSLADAGRLELRRRDTDLVALAEEVLDDCAARAITAEVTLHLKRSPLDLHANIDPDRITQVLANLLDNAIRVTPAGGTVRLALEDAGAEARLSVTDSGPGMSADARAHAFDRFYQDRDTRGASGASGLGLAIVKALVELHGGRVTAVEVEHGACVEVVVPKQALDGVG